MSIPSAKTIRESWIQPAIDLRRSVYRQASEMIRMYATSGYRDGFGRDTWKNYAYEWCAVMVPHQAWQNPAVRVTDMGIEDEQTYEYQCALQSWIDQVRLVEQLRLISYDLQFAFGVAKIDMEPTPGLRYPNPAFVPMRPRLERLSPALFFSDPEAAKHGGPRFEGHVCIKEADKMLAEVDADGRPKYVREAVEQLSQQDGLREVESDLMIHDGIRVNPESKPVVIFEVWIREENALVSLGFSSGGDAVFLRNEPRESRVGVTGPYRKFGQHVVPDQVYPLAPLQVVSKQLDEINRHRSQASKDADTAKRLAIASGNPGAMSSMIVSNLLNAESGSLLSLPGFNGIVNTFEFGGPMKSTLDYIEWAESKIDRLTGLSNAMRAEGDPDKTATADAIAAQYADVRLRYAMQCFGRDTGESLRAVLDMMYSRKSIEFPIVHEDPVTGIKRRATFRGGPSHIPSQWPWAPALTVKIEPYSMEYVNSAMMRMQTQAAQEHVLRIAEAVMSGAPVNPQAMIDDMFETLNMPQTAAKYLRPEIMGMAAGVAAFQSGMDPAFGGGAPAPARGMPYLRASMTTQQGVGGVKPQMVRAG